MRALGSNTLAHLQSRGGLAAYALVWVEARNRTSGLVETLGLWTGAQDRTFTIAGQPRSYVGAGGLAGVPPITMQVGLAVRMQQLRLAPVTAEVVQLIRGYDARHAPVEVHVAFFEPRTRTLIEEPTRVFKGYIDAINISEGVSGGESSCEVTVASSARALTRTLPLRRSDEVQKRKGGDRFRKYADISGSVDVWWGQRRRT
jgi:hypothetical protein